MRQMVIRITDKSEDAQLLYKRGGKELWKTIALDRLSELISNAAIQHRSGEKPQMLDKRIIAIGNGSMIFRTPETFRRIYTVNDEFELFSTNTSIFEEFRNQLSAVPLPCDVYRRSDQRYLVLYLLPLRRRGYRVVLYADAEYDRQRSYVYRDCRPKHN